MALARTVVGLYESKSAFGTSAFSTGEFTPPANSLLLVTVEMIGNGTTGDLGTPTIEGGGLTYTPITSGFGSPAWSLKAITFRAQVGASPSAMKITVDDDNNQNIDAYTVSVIAYTGHDTTTPAAGAVTSGSTNIGDGEESQTLATAPSEADDTVNVIALDTSLGPPKPVYETGWSSIHEGKLSGEGGLAIARRSASTSTTVKIKDVWNPGGGSFTKGIMYSFIVKAATGGKALTLELSDSAGFSESRGAGSNHPQADVLALAESMARTAGLSKVDSLALVETVGRVFGLSRAEALTVVDAVERTGDLSRSESVAVSDLLVRSWASARLVSEGFSAADINAISLAKVLIDGASLGDAAGLAVAASRHDDLNLLDLLSLAIWRAVEDTIGLSDSAARALGLSLADSVALLDQIEGSGAAGAALEDVLRLGELRQLSIVRVEADAVAVADSVAKAGGHRAADLIGLADALGATVGLVEADRVALGDSLAKSSTHVEADSITFSESIGKRISTSVSDALAVADSIARRAAKFLADIFVATDPVEVEGGERPEVPVYLSLSDVATTTLVLGDQAATLLLLADRAATVLTLSNRPATQLAVSDAPTTTLTLEDNPA